MTSPAPRTHTTPDTSHTELRALITAAAGDIARMVQQIRTDLLDTHQPVTTIGATAATREAMDDVIRAERRDRIAVTTTPDPTARQWLSPTATGSGAVPAPVALTAASVEAATTLAVTELAEMLQHRLRRAGQPLINTRHDDSGSGPGRGWRPLTVITRAAEVLDDGRLLHDTHRQLEQLIGPLARVVDGDGLSIPADPVCPACHQATLIADLHTHPPVITCDRNHTTGRRSRCRCTDSYCHCHRNPSHRHTWTDTRRRSRRIDMRWTWYGLRDAQDAWRRALTTPTHRNLMTHTLSTSSDHTIEITLTPGEPATYTAHCAAPPDAACHQTYACWLDETCDPDDSHTPTCEQTLVQVDYCLIAGYLTTNNPELHAGDPATLTIPADVLVDHDGITWTPTTGETS